MTTLRSIFRPRCLGSLRSRGMFSERQVHHHLGDPAIVSAFNDSSSLSFDSRYQPWERTNAPSSGFSLVQHDFRQPGKLICITWSILTKARERLNKQCLQKSTNFPSSWVTRSNKLTSNSRSVHGMQDLAQTKTHTWAKYLFLQLPAIIRTGLTSLTSSDILREDKRNFRTSKCLTFDLQIISCFFMLSDCNGRFKCRNFHSLEPFIRCGFPSAIFG